MKAKSKGKKPSPDRTMDASALVDRLLAEPPADERELRARLAGGAKTEICSQLVDRLARGEIRGSATRGLVSSALRQLGLGGQESRLVALVRDTRLWFARPWGCPGSALDLVSGACAQSTGAAVGGGDRPPDGFSTGGAAARRPGAARDGRRHRRASGESASGQRRVAAPRAGTVAARALHLAGPGVRRRACAPGSSPRCTIPCCSGSRSTAGPRTWTSCKSWAPRSTEPSSGPRSSAASCGSASGHPHPLLAG